MSRSYGPFVCGRLCGPGEVSHFGAWNANMFEFAASKELAARLVSTL